MERQQTRFSVMDLINGAAFSPSLFGADEYAALSPVRKKIELTADPVQSVAETKKGPSRPITQLITFGPLGVETYQRWASAPPNDPYYAIRKITDTFDKRADGSNAAARAQRLEMWSLYEELLARLGDRLNEPVLQTVDSFVREHSPLAAQELTEPRSGLGKHLAEMEEFCGRFLLTDQGKSRFPQLLSDREAALLAQVAAELHDVLKYLGTPGAQVAPDHELMAAELIRRTFYGQTVILNGLETQLTAKDADFLASVIGDHENLEKEAGRTGRIASSEVKDRAKALFFVADVLTGVLVENPAGSGQWSLDQRQLEERFIDLYFRHIDPVKGKIFRPEWGAATIVDLIATLRGISTSHNVPFTGTPARPGLADALIAAGLTSIERALTADAQRWEEARGTGSGKPDKFLDSAVQIPRIAAAREALLAIKRQ